MKSLIILAHPSSKGFSRQIASRYAAIKKDSEIIDLYAEEWQQSFLAFESPKNIPNNEVRNRIQEKITEAEELVFVFPLWWGFVPAILKNFIDQNLSAGFAFIYKNGKPKGLLTGKTARIFVTCDAPKWMYAMLFFPFFTILKIGTFRFCGIKTKSVKLFDKKHKRSDEELERWLKKVEGMARG